MSSHIRAAATFPPLGPERVARRGKRREARVEWSPLRSIAAGRAARLGSLGPADRVGAGRFGSRGILRWAGGIGIPAAIPGVRAFDLAGPGIVVAALRSIAAGHAARGAVRLGSLGPADRVGDGGRIALAARTGILARARTGCPVGSGGRNRVCGLLVPLRVRRLGRACRRRAAGRLVVPVRFAPALRQHVDLAPRAGNHDLRCAVFRSLPVRPGARADAALDQHRVALAHELPHRLCRNAERHDGVPLGGLSVGAVPSLEALGGGEAEQRHLVARLQRAHLGIASGVAHQRRPVHRQHGSGLLSVMVQTVVSLPMPRPDRPRRTGVVPRLGSFPGARVFPWTKVFPCPA